MHSGGSEVRDFENMGPSRDGVITGLSLQLTAETGNYYYVTVAAVNGAGMWSQVLSSR